MLILIISLLCVYCGETSNAGLAMGRARATAMPEVPISNLRSHVYAL